MDDELLKWLPALSACPGKPICDLRTGWMCVDHRDVYLALQKLDASWRDTVIAAREARDRAEAALAAINQKRKETTQDEPEAS